MVRVGVLFVWGVLLFGYGLSGPLYRTEALRAKIAQETLAGQWLVPTLYGQPFVTKPPGAYVAIALCSIPAGEVTEVSARLPSAIAALLTVLFLFWHLRGLIGEQRAFWMAIFLPVSFLWLDKAPSAEIDMLQLGWVTWSLIAFHRAFLREEQRRPSFGWWVAALFCVAGGLLTKWTAPAFFYLTVIPFLVIQRRWNVLFSWRHLTAALIATVLVAGWAFLATQEIGWQTLRETIGNEAAQRFAPGRRGKPYPWLEAITFPLLVLASNTLSALAVMLTLRRSFRDRLSESEHSLVLLGHCWIWPNLLFWSLPAQHNVRYLLPMIPAFGLLGGLWWVKWFENRPTVRWRQAVFIAPLIAWLAAKGVFTEVIQPDRVANRNAHETGRELAGLVPAGEHLTIDKLKDEGILFYYGRPVTQNRGAQSPWALLMEAEWQAVAAKPDRHLVARLLDQQGAAIYLVRDDSPEMAACPFLIPPLAQNSTPSPR
ncbi:ArnT family glycosyltransferase [Zavarzinella formosa]|uniref:ArnT family glycosyltransferase n=1 Tax=Zavarzinella formosa TaxID=360055 RepID=UPI0002FC3148|nr:glycosyltransferase family 39 protein [Zavarzinella formosa]